MLLLDAIQIALRRNNKESSLLRQPYLPPMKLRAQLLDHHRYSPLGTNNTFIHPEQSKYNGPSPHLTLTPQYQPSDPTTTQTHPTVTATELCCYHRRLRRHHPSRMKESSHPLNILLLKKRRDSGRIIIYNLVLILIAKKKIF